MAEYAGRFDARSLTSADCGEVVKLCAQIEASAASVKVLAAARSAECRSWQREGYRSAAEKLADQAGMSPGAARRALETGQRMADQPEVAAAAAAGELSLEQAAAVSDGTAADPEAAQKLIDKAKRSSMPELDAEVANVKAAHCDQEARREERHKRRSFRRQYDRDGALQAHIYGHPEDGVRLGRMVDAVRRRLNMLRRQAGGAFEPLEALDYDALMLIADVAAGKDGELKLADLLELGLFPQLDAEALASRSQPPLFSTTDPPDPSKKKLLAGGPLKLMIRVDLDVLFRGAPSEGELCEIAGYGPVPVSVVQDLIETENPFICGILTRSERIIGVYHHGRHPNAYQRSALDFLYPTCAVEGCTSKAGLQYDHRVDWSRTQITAFDLLDRLCGFHHGKKTHEGWALVEGRGKRAFVPPDDPRYPRSQISSRSGPGP